jgi:tRNA(Arg) A34 adenosine deaminase TadA
MREAIGLAREGMRAGRGGPFGAVVVKEGRIVGRGANSVLSDRDPTAHAEIVALRDACRILGTHELSGCAVYSSCEPCPMCLAALYWARVDRLWYAATQEDAAAAGFDDSLINREVRKLSSRRRLAMLPLLRDEAVGLFKEWSELPGKIPY